MSDKTYKYKKVENKKRKLPAYLNEEEFMQIIKLVKKAHHRLAFILGFSSGLRISEIVNLRKDQVDLKGKKIFIRNSKWGKDRVVPLPKGFPEKYLKQIPLKCGIRALQIAFKNYVRKSGITKPDLHFHSLRHSFAIRCMDKGIPLNQIQVLLGHESISTTSIYLRINPKDALENYDKLW